MAPVPQLLVPTVGNATASFIPAIISFVAGPAMSLLDLAAHPHRKIEGGTRTRQPALLKIHHAPGTAAGEPWVLEELLRGITADITSATTAVFSAPGWEQDIPGEIAVALARHPQDAIVHGNFSFAFPPWINLRRSPQSPLDTNPGFQDGEASTQAGLPRRSIPPAPTALLDAFFLSAAATETDTDTPSRISGKFMTWNAPLPLPSTALAKTLSAHIPALASPAARPDTPTPPRRRDAPHTPRDQTYDFLEEATEGFFELFGFHFDRRASAVIRRDDVFETLYDITDEMANSLTKELQSWGWLDWLVGDWPVDDDY